jgi:hypothetical protein
MRMVRRPDVGAQIVSTAVRGGRLQRRKRG